MARESESDVAAAGRLLDAIRAIDGSRTLAAILDGLADAARRETGRAAILLVANGRVRGWTFAGFDPEVGPAASVDLPLDGDGLVAEAVRSHTRATTRTATAGGSVILAAPDFARLPEDRVALAVPLVVDGHVVAVLYADDAAAADRPAARGTLLEAVEILAAHASQVLANVMLRRVQRLRRHGGVGLTAEPAPPTPGASGTTEQDERHRPDRAARRDEPVEHDEESARRYARLLVSEIKLYYEPAVNEGRQHGDLLLRLRPEIARARRLYEERIPPAVRERADYFEQELVRTLANGDPALLGQAT